MRKGIIFLLMLGLLAEGTSLYAQKLPRNLLRTLLNVPAGQSIDGSTRKILQGLSASQRAVLTRELKQVASRLTQENLSIKLSQEQIFDNTRSAIFRAVPVTKGPSNSYTGTLFEVETNGKKEVFGVIPMHALKSEYKTNGFLSHKFSAIVEQNGELNTVPAWVVQLSSSKTGDIALVKFRDQDAAQLSPLVLAGTDPSFSETLYTQGYACNLLSHTLVRASGQTSLGMITTRLPAAREGERAGFCGSPLLNDQSQLAGIHIGSNYLSEAQQSAAFFDAFQIKNPSLGDEGYAAPASFLRSMVEAYHHPGKEVIPVSLLDEELFRLPVDEYISKVEILDASQHVLWQKETQHKVSLRPVETALLLFPQARWVRFLIGKTYWQNSEIGPFVRNDSLEYRVKLVHLPQRP